MATSAEHNHSVSTKPSYDDVNTTAVYMVGIISAILTIVIISVVQGFTYQMMDGVASKKADKYHELWVAPVIKEQKEHLEGGDGITPISATMQLVEQKYGKGKTDNN
jgi:hypothetical protein